MHHNFTESKCPSWVELCSDLVFVFEQDDHESASSSTSRSVSDSAKAVAKPRRLQQAAPTDPDLPPGE